ncbi:Plant-specific TFIIB-related protein [Vigna angularis]|uniref:Plant-specific TFIIB-related protein n=1 Tax=Phaseolus angularis TaxID=3914 RepID=A0A8T0JLQ4_PHAAN|nr:Plant-specific TFIIB-related protein [Vigna angularis]
MGATGLGTGILLAMRIIYHFYLFSTEEARGLSFLLPFVIPKKVIISLSNMTLETHVHSSPKYPSEFQFVPLVIMVGRCATTSSGRSITECTSCGRNEDEDPFEPTGFITAFSTWSLEPSPLYLQSSLSFSGHLAELERTLESSSSSSSSSSSTVVVDNLRAYMQIIDVASILGLDCDISDHAFQLFRDCCSATCLRNRSVEALATAALVQAIREAQEPRTLQEISIAANVQQKEIGKYIKILGEALQLSQPINSNSISVHMPRFCTLLQLNKSAQELATHIGEVVINKCFCTRRNPISISAAAIYLACQLEDKRKTQAEICKVTGLTEVTLRKVYKELLENWDDLLPSNYTPAVPPERAFPTTIIASGRSSTVKADAVEAISSLDSEKLTDIKPSKPNEVSGLVHQPKGKDEAEGKSNAHGSHSTLNQQSTFWQSQLPCEDTNGSANGNALKSSQLCSPPASSASSVMRPFSAPPSAGPSNVRLGQSPKIMPDFVQKSESIQDNLELVLYVYFVPLLISSLLEDLILKGCSSIAGSSKKCITSVPP